MEIFDKHNRTILTSLASGWWSKRIFNRTLDKFTCGGLMPRWLLPKEDKREMQTCLECLRPYLLCAHTQCPYCEGEKK